MEGCGVSSLPEGFGELSNLQKLNLSWCKHLCSLPASFGNLNRLVKLEIHHNAQLTELPGSIGGLKALSYLDASHCQLSDNGLPAGILYLSSLRIIHLEHNVFRNLPGGLEKLSGLWELHLDGCSELSALPALPPSLEILSARDCMSLDTLSCFSGLTSLSRLDVSKSHRVTELPGLKSLQGLTTLDLVGCKHIFTDTLGICLRGLKSLESVFIGGPGVSPSQLQSLYDSLEAISFDSECLMSSTEITSNWFHAQADGCNAKGDNCFEYCAVDREISYCAGYIVCCLSLGQVFDCEGTNRLCYSIERNQRCEIIHPEMDDGSEHMLEVRVVRVEGEFDFKWLRMGDKLRVNVRSDHQNWKACFKFLMYDPLSAVDPHVEENPYSTITFGVSGDSD